ncbi:MAG: pyruvate ferredoxin oxidoreductase [Candidatus Tectomicrobia bacterium]|uniref:Pyruvate ferredoxin oxidoreductase n=1 Tax=Tectimicrobiota bacterium TaxID=2528274 RepID=A0A933GM57_UNCTE|nr:pyruvate ferredoxin oxidoreductase [Candidatus Tectomicrobia bacterium]
MKKVLMGNHAASYGAMLSKVQVIAAYPITPQTQIVEELSEMCYDGRLEAKFLKVESEHSAMACCIGAAITGCRTFTATSSQGLALMHELLHWAAGARLPVVMVNVNRALAPGWNIWTDQSDALSQRDTGWIQFYCTSNQEILDTIILAYRVSEQALLPAMVVYDAFVSSHTYEIVEIPDPVQVDKLLPPHKPFYFLSQENPATFNSLTSPDYYQEMREDMQMAMDGTAELIEKAALEFKEIFGRFYPSIEPYRIDDAEIILVTSGTASSTSQIVIDQLRTEGIKVGQVRIRIFRPFPGHQLRQLIKNCRKIAVLDRNLSVGVGGIFAHETKAALYGMGNQPTVFGFVTGLGGRDITPEIIEQILRYTERQDKPGEKVIWMGSKQVKMNNSKVKI